MTGDYQQINYTMEHETKNELITEGSAIDLPIGDRTRHYIGMNYTIGEGQLQIGDRVIVHPVVGRSQSQEPFEANIELHKIKWANNMLHDFLMMDIAETKGRNVEKLIKEFPSKEVYEVCTNVIGQHGAVMNDYLFNRLERVGGN